MTTAPIRPFTYGARDGAKPPSFTLPNNVELHEELVYTSALGQDWPLDLFVPRPRPHLVPPA